MSQFFYGSREQSVVGNSRWDRFITWVTDSRTGMCNKSEKLVCHVFIYLPGVLWGLALRPEVPELLTIVLYYPDFGESRL